MKKSAIFVIAAAFAFAACGGKAAAAKAVGDLFDNTTSEINAISAELKKADDAKEVAAGLNKFYDTMSGMKAKMEELEKTHGGSMKGDMPAELKTKMENFQSAAKNLMSGDAMKVMAKFGKSPEVMAAVKKLQSLKG